MIPRYWNIARAATATLSVVKRVSLRVVLARRLREVAAERELALMHVADREGIGRSHLWRLLNAEASATLDALEKVAEALDIDPLALLTPSGVQTPPIAAELKSRPASRRARTKHRR
jgi:transcriptional regulator with XRE-family HTH domain